MFSQDVAEYECAQEVLEQRPFGATIPADMAMYRCISISCAVAAATVVAVDATSLRRSGKFFLGARIGEPYLH
jgi:hypothetical protein